MSRPDPHEPDTDDSTDALMAEAPWGAAEASPALAASRARAAAEELRPGELEQSVVAAFDTGVVIGDQTDRGVAHRQLAGDAGLRDTGHPDDRPTGSRVPA